MYYRLFTRWIVAAAVPDCSAQTTAEALFNEDICKIWGTGSYSIRSRHTFSQSINVKQCQKLVDIITHFNHIPSSIKWDD
jgi:hypothetical protein